MDYLIRGAQIHTEKGFLKKDILVENGVIANISDSISPMDEVFLFQLNNCFVFPGLTDVHVHLRQPGFFYKETIKTGTLAAAHGGFTSVCSMPNLNPVPDCLENLAEQTKIIERDALVHVYPYGSITKGQKQGSLSDMEALADKVIAFSDDGVGVQSEELMLMAMKKAKSLGKMIVAHCEDNALLTGGCIHDGEYARQRGIKGISSASEWNQISRDIGLVRKTGCDYHVCHISTWQSVDLIRRAKSEGLPISCETAPHYLTLCDKDLQDDGRFRMNPPLRSERDKMALIEGVCDGTIDLVATDHAPHSTEEKAGGLRNSLNGIVGLETSFPVLYTKLVMPGIISLSRLIELMQVNPKRRFKIGTSIEIGQPADLTVFYLNAKYNVNPESFLTLGRSTPFAGWEVFGKCLLTTIGGEIVYRDEAI